MHPLVARRQNRLPTLSSPDDRGGVVLPRSNTGYASDIHHHVPFGGDLIMSRRGREST